MITLSKEMRKVCIVCKSECTDNYVYISAPVNSRIACMCKKDAENLVDTCKKFGIEFALY